MLFARRRLAFVLLAWSAAAPAARAAAQPSTATLSATIGPQATLTLSTLSITFPGAGRAEAAPESPDSDR